MKRLVAISPLVLLVCLTLAGCEPPPAGVATGPPPPPPPPGTEVPAPEPETELVKAEAGVGIKGRSLDEYEGIIVTPAKTFFTAKEKIFFEIEFPGNYRPWRVLEDRAPADYAELKERFLDPLGLTAKMPKLPEGHRYAWDAETEQLMVERPKLKAAP